MHRFTKGCMRFAALLLTLVLVMGCLGVAQAEISYSGYVSLRLMDGEPSVGADARYKLTIRKSGTVTAVLKNHETGAENTVLNASYPSAQNVLLTVPGSLIDNGHNYTLTVTLKRGGTIGQAVHTFTTVQTVSRIDALSVTSSFEPLKGESLQATFALPFPGNVTAVIRNSAGVQVAVVAHNAPHKACAHALTWDGLTSEGTIAPGGRYTFEITCSNSAGTSPAATASFQITGDSAGASIGRVQGTIQALLLPAQPKDGEKATFNIRASHTGKYTLKIKDVTTGRSHKFTGTLQAGMNTITPGLVCEGGHEYLFQMVHQVSRKNTGKAQMSYTAHIDPPSISVSAPAKLQAGYGAALPIQYTTATSGDVILFVTDLSCSSVLWSAYLAGQSKGTHTYYWDGRDNSGNLLSSGSYILASESRNAIGAVYGNSIKLQYEGAIAQGTPFRQGAISIFGAAENAEPVERTPVKLRYQASAVGTLKITLRNTANGHEVVVYNEKTSAGARTITIPGDHFAASTYEIEAVLTSGRKTVGRAIAYVKPYTVQPMVSNLQYSDDFNDSKWGDVYSVSFDTASTGYVYARVQNAATGSFVSNMIEGQYTPAGHITCSWDGTDSSGNYAPNGEYRFFVFYDDSYGTRSNISVKSFTFSGISYPEGVLGYTVVGVGNHKTPIKIYNAPDGRNIATTYGVSATFNVIKDLGDWLYVETSAATGNPLRGYVQADHLQKVALTSPYRIEVNVSRVGPNAQTMYIYKDGQLFDSFKVSTGRSEGSTPTGTFCLLNRKPFFTVSSAGAICYDALRVVGGVCIHRIPEINGSYRSTQNKLGSPASAGCIRVPIEKSTWMYENIPDTTLIHSYRSAN